MLQGEQPEKRKTGRFGLRRKHSEDSTLLPRPVEFGVEGVLHCHPHIIAFVGVCRASTGHRRCEREWIRSSRPRFHKKQSVGRGQRRWPSRGRCLPRSADCHTLFRSQTFLPAFSTPDKDRKRRTIRSFRLSLPATPCPRFSP